MGTLRDARGDLARCTGMKIAALVGLLKDIDNQLMITSRFMKALHISFLTANQVDRQYGIREKITNLLAKVYTIISGAAAQVQNDINEGGRGEEEGGEGNDFVPPFPSHSTERSARGNGSRNQYASYKTPRWMEDETKFRQY